MSVEKPGCKRELWPDVMRGILILLVVFHHSAAWAKLLYTPFFMTGFFFISGYFHSESKPFIPFVIGKFKNLIIPTFTIGFVVLVILKKQQAFSLHHLYEWYVCGSVFWFLFCLFAAHALQYVLVRLFSRKYLFLMLSSSIIGIGALIFSHHANVYPWHAQVACVMQPAMALGYIARQKDWFNIPMRRKLFIFSSLSFLYIILLSIAFFIIHMPWCDLISNEFGNVYLFLPMSLSGTLCLAYFAALICQGQNILSLIGRHTLVLYITHRVFIVLVLGGTSILFRDIAHMAWRPIDHTHIGAWNVTCLLAICFATAAGICLSMLLNRYAPWLLGKGSYIRKEGRK